ncbi:hypothetical protein HOY80DRAFT_1113712 [Tuber brumale]|nr:hypothetical protein HOY80DRAFT_1113712 [Tuber brumale]
MFVNQDIGKVIGSGFGSLCDGANSEFCLTLNFKGNYGSDWKKWWMGFSKFQACQMTARPFSRITVEDYNYLKTGFKARWLLAKPKDWEGLQDYIIQATTFRNLLKESTTQIPFSSITSTKRSRASTTANSIVSKKLRTESQPEPTVQLPEVKPGPELESELEVAEEAELEEGSNREFQSHEPTEEIYMRQHFSGKAPTPGIPPLIASNSPPLSPCHSELFDTKNFSLYQFATGGYPDPLDPSKPWSLPETLPENLEPTSKSLAKDVNVRRTPNSSM